jgi:hypothetical protein
MWRCPTQNLRLKLKSIGITIDGFPTLITKNLCLKPNIQTGNSKTKLKEGPRRRVRREHTYIYKLLRNQITIDLKIKEQQVLTEYSILLKK